MSPKPRSYQRPPVLWPAYLRGLLSRKRGLQPGATIPRLEAQLAAQPADGERLRRYLRLCGMVESEWMPITWPQVLAGPLHMVLLTDPAFPIAAMGIVHARNRLEQLRPIRATEPLGLRSYVEGHRDVPAGIEVDLVSEADVAGEVVWRNVITAVRIDAEKRKANRSERQEAPLAAAPPAWERSLVMRVAADTGRHYAALAGDYNPIHLYPATARPFGFKRPIVHGMWSLARCLGEVADDLPGAPCAVEVAFKRPVFLPGKVLLVASREGTGVRFSLQSADGTKVHLLGTAAPLDGRSG